MCIRDRVSVSQETPKPKKKEYLVAVSGLIEPFYAELFSELNRDNPVDVVPSLTIVRERILDKQSGREADRQAVYSLAVKLIDGMIDAGEERTQALETLLRLAAQPRAALESDRTASSKQLFLDTQTRRSMESLKRRKPPLDPLFTQLRTAENNWNSRLSKSALTEQLGLSGLPPAIVTLDEGLTRQNPLEQKAYDQHRVTNSSRQRYYEQYGSRRRN